MTTHKDTVIDEPRMPHDPALPKGDILIDLFSRISSMSDALHDPDGLLQTVLRDQERKASLRHMAQMNVLRKILAEVLEVKARLDTVEETVETHHAKLTLIEHSEIQ